MRVPTATYRIQISPDFSLEELGKISAYLADFGISTIYSAPFFQSRKGSTHGYDIIDPFSINREIGSLKDFRDLREDLNKKNIGWLQDIVPNHMAFDPQNIWLSNIFELGPASKYYHFFDINWKYRKRNKLMAPFLGAPLEQVLNKNELQIEYDNGFHLKYFEHRFPMSSLSYPEILQFSSAEQWREKFGIQLEHDEQWQELKIAFSRELEDDGDFKSELEQQLNEINASRAALEKILELQYFLPVYWKETEREINYRRFFTINDLICLRMEDREVFENYHYFIGELIESGLIDGLRIDHIDGLFEPTAYLKNLRKLFGEDFYLIAEKILEQEEELPIIWPVQGTTGYEFLAWVSQLLTDKRNEEVFTAKYKELVSQMPGWEDLLYQKKLFILKERMGGELNNLFYFLKTRVLSEHDLPENEDDLMEALCAFLTGFPIYRIYPEKFPLSSTETNIIDQAFENALAKFSRHRDRLDLIKSVFTGKAHADKDQMLYFLKRCQQYTGPLAAKGGEDTAFYIYNRLISHNEVGDSPGNFAITPENFHQKMLWRKKHFPLSLNTTATHDTKRGEDARMRLNLLSEKPEEWFEIIRQFMEIAKDVRNAPDIPDTNEEYLIYQALVAAMPFEKEEDFPSRTKEYLQKVLREAKIHSSWSDPDKAYEEEVFQFVDDILKNKDFKEAFNPFWKKSACLAVIKSLAQCLLKICAPGIPDIYQGSELWDLSFVDPDNRRPVDYVTRKLYLVDILENKNKNVKHYIKELKEHYSNGKIKMFCLHLALEQRNQNPSVFEKGNYLPMKISGEASESVLAFARIHEESWFLVIIPLVVSEIFQEKDFVQRKDVFADSVLYLPEDAPADWVSIFTGETFSYGRGISLEGIFNDFPVVLLRNSQS